VGSAVTLPIINMYPIVEHISLEEISSDSDIGGSESRRGKWVYLKKSFPKISVYTDLFLLFIKQSQL